MQLAPLKPGENQDTLIRGAFAEADRWAAVVVDPSNHPAPFVFGAAIPEVHGYRVVREIHRGGQGIVYEAVQLSTDRIVAIKFLLGGTLAGLLDRARFDREIRILSRLQHGGIVNIYDTGIARGCRFFVMDYVDGQPIDQFVQSGRIDPRELLNLFARICDVVFAAHVRGFIHRDLKPSHILIDGNHQPHIVDFGLGKIVDEDENRTSSDTSSENDGVQTNSVQCTQTGQFIGSLAWASPEQAEGQHGALDTRTDVYSLGVILYYLLTERFPYAVEGHPRDVLARIINQAPHPLRSGDVRGVGGELETIVLKCLAKDPARRYQSAGELAAEIRRHLAGDPIEAMRHHRAYILRKSIYRHRLLIGSAAGIVLSALAFWFYQDRQATAYRGSLEASVREGRSALYWWDWIADIQQAGRDKTEAAVLASGRLSDRLAELEHLSFSDPMLTRRIHYRIADVCMFLPRFSEYAVLHAEKAVAAARSVEPFDEELLIRSQKLLAYAVRSDQPRRAIAINQEAAERARSLYGECSAEYLDALGQLAATLRHAGDFEEHERVAQQMIELASASVPSALPIILKGYAEWLCDDLSRFDEAYSNQVAALAGAREAGDSKTIAHHLHSFGHLLLKMQRYDEAAEVMSECVARRSSVYAENDIDYFYVLVSKSQWCEALVHQGRFNEAQQPLLDVDEGYRQPVAPRWQTALAEHRQMNLERLVLLYSRWDKVMPNQGFDQEAARFTREVEQIRK